MFIEQGISKENPFWKYIIGSLIIIMAAFIGQLPLLFVILGKALNGGGIPSTNEEMLQYLEPNLSLFLIMISFVFAIGGVYLAVKYLHKQTFLSVTTSRPKVDWNRILFSFSIWALFTIVTTFLYFYYEPESFVWNFKPTQFAILFVIAVVLIPFQTSTEEYIFRGYLMQGFGNLAKNKWFPLIMTSVIFGGMHIANPEVSKLGYIIMVYYIGTGLFLGIITLMDDGMELALGFHAANNLVSALLISSDWSALQTHSLYKDVSDPSAGFDVLLPIFIIFPIILLIFSRKYKWTDWKEKLTGKISTNSITYTYHD
ncbi:CPBP family intramembrane glutamic endopeptidase [Flavobacterium aquatile]|uniref:Abortive phage infection protein n=1 Tax=Flavobacterium aquatile LMG 4008 = ATCC 11947 TaxID=1453498 RepID=A0A095STK3_9FLAO|nr:type II CAAX endopeptidase family protein [Flavobacterium aquatile]KGD67659.1 abortive phage infection protein [Flavobacterium aquatile LMG 4008 = ATCC 11947]OXA67524.1 CAAX protease family protein [Flavobacterium aquatile LMG 4008 = ATCC 11947]GEC79138.1 abortive infection protein [Flavobacterium aquatile]